MARKKKTDEDESLNQNAQNDSDDTFGLPDIEYKPLNREEETQVPSSEVTPEEEPQPATSTYENVQKPMEQQPEYTYDPEEESSPVWPKVIGILLVIAVALGATWYFISYRPAQEKARLEKERLAIEAQKEKDRLAAEEQRLRDEAQRKADSLAAATPKAGAFEVLTERTSRYYVIVASAVDDDLLTDYAKKLTSQGVSSKLIPPFGKYKLYRLTIADGDTFAAAQEIANGKKSEYGDALWVLKY